MYLANNEIIKAVRGFDFNSVTAEMHSKYEAGIAQDGMQNNRVLAVSGNVATINISGVLTKAYTFMTWIMSGTAYDEISGALALAENDPEIDQIVINMNSGGGQVSGLFDLIAQMQGIKTQVDCFVAGMCCSAAYAIASQCDTITASSDGETLGSIGIVVDMFVSEDHVSVTSSNAPKKRPDASTDDGIADIRAELDEYEELFLESIAAGRKTTVDSVIATYGQGATTTARNALKSGMIDSIKSNLNSQGDPDSSITANNEDSLMNIAELQAKHPELYAEVVAVGEASGKTKEQDRVSAFAEIGKASGAMDLAMACIADGTEPSATISMKFEAERMKTANLNAMADDNVDTSNVNADLPAGEEVSKTEQAALDAAAEMGVTL